MGIDRNRDDRADNHLVNVWACSNGGLRRQDSAAVAMRDQPSGTQEMLRPPPQLFVDLD
jgi:hypothetical protein